ncbi:ATP-dependent Clp protease adapter ClpS [Corticibacter populi]|uniref:ATP-dependent Clp protease adapter protein ClpS n=1 Tax=Corticibacter populi TaxID=1550736 RepID=A0A3M6QX93_9BURK|nr:ATP-dependent Clp protease adapter ClpS [Corticibacter populi]RMX07636.1 ATP-dependent Clp protease adapter ClpS [Corticibacter populi]
MSAPLFNASSPPGKTPAAPPYVAPPQEDATVVAERRMQKLSPPPMYQVVMLNDDFTPMEFVIAVLQEFFGKNRELATQIMLKIHLDGRGVCGVYTRDIANTKVALVMDAAAQAGHPLQCICEPLAD